MAYGFNYTPPTESASTFFGQVNNAYGLSISNPWTAYASFTDPYGNTTVSPVVVMTVSDQANRAASIALGGIGLILAGAVLLGLAASLGPAVAAAFAGAAALQFALTVAGIGTGALGAWVLSWPGTLVPIH